MTFVCGTHRAFIYERGGEVLVGELTPLTMVRWRRVRDDISDAHIILPTFECCELLGDLRTVLHELHITRNDVPVWQGPITRIEYQWDLVDIFAEDMLWVAKRRVLQEGYDQSYPNIGDVVDRMDWLLREQCFAQFGDPWNMVAHLNPMTHAGGPRSSRSVPAFQMYVWEDLDKYAEDMGADYTVVNRDIYYFDFHYAWNIIPDLDEIHISQFPRVVEYGNELATRVYVTNGLGFEGHAVAPPAYTAETMYGTVDHLISNTSDGQLDGEPTVEELAEWADSAAHALDDRYPSPVGVVVPANSTLMPGAPWEIEDMIPGSWFQVNVTRLCRSVSDYQRLHEVVVTESAPSGESVQFTCQRAPADMIIPV